MAETRNAQSPLRPLGRPDSADPTRLRPLARPEGLAPEEAAELADAGSAPTRPQTRPDGLGVASAETQDAATVAGVLPLGETTLIGLFNGPDGGTALLRLPGGHFVKVAAGGLVAGGRVVAINEDGIRVERDGDEITLTMPG